MDWIKFSEQEPENGQLCLVCDSYRRRVKILIFNKYDECWDDEDGDEYWCDLNYIKYWCPLPEYKGD